MFINILKVIDGKTVFGKEPKENADWNYNGKNGYGPIK